MGYTGQPSPSQQELQEQVRERMPEVSRAWEGIWKWGECGESWVVSSGLPWGMLGGRERGRKGELSGLGGLRAGAPCRSLESGWGVRGAGVWEEEGWRDADGGWGWTRRSPCRRHRLRGRREGDESESGHRKQDLGEEMEKGDGMQAFRGLSNCMLPQTGCTLVPPSSRRTPRTLRHFSAGPAERGSGSDCSSSGGSTLCFPLL